MAPSNPWKTATLVLLGVALGVLIVVPLSRNLDFSFLKPDEQKKSINAYVKAQAEEWKFYDTNVSRAQDGFFALGKKDAPITMVEYSDYQCPFCDRFFSNTFPGIKNEYVKTGQVYFVYKDLPLSIHPNAMPAAQTAHCAGEQGKYFQMHDLIFHFQDQWSDMKDAMPFFGKLVSGLDLKTSDFGDCIRLNRYQNLTKKSMEEADRAEITGTPGFIINGQVVVGAQPLSFFQQAFAQVLTGTPAGAPGTGKVSEKALEVKDKTKK